MQTTGEPIVAKKKTPAKPKAPQSGTWRSKPIIVQLRGSEEFKAVIEKLAEMDGNTVSGLVDRALRSYARTLGYDKPLPKR